MSEVRLIVSRQARTLIGDKAMEKLKDLVRGICVKMGFSGAYIGKAWHGLYVEFFGVRRA